MRFVLWETGSISRTRNFWKRVGSSARRTMNRSSSDAAAGAASSSHERRSIIGTASALPTATAGATKRIARENILSAPSCRGTRTKWRPTKRGSL